MGAENLEIESERRKYDLLRSQLEIERASFLSHWKDLGHNGNSRRARFAVSDVNRGDRRNTNIIDNTAVMSLRTLRSGMMAGLTSPARPWFRLTTGIPELNDVAAVKLWLDQVTNRMTAVYLKSNLYNVLPLIYGDMGQFGTSAMMVEEDFDDVVRYYAFPIGTYMIAINAKGVVDTFLRDFRMTVKQLVQRFGRHDDMPNGKKQIDWSKLSSMVKNLWETDQREKWVDVCHVISPNDMYDKSKSDSEFKKFKSVYYERGSTGANVNTYASDEQNKFLRVKGYDYFPVLCPRWEVSAEDAYGTSCPGMDALGDIRQLQVGEKRKMQAVDKIVNPPMVAPTSMRSSKTSVLPGDISYADLRDGQQGFKPVYEVKLSISELDGTQEQCRKRIEKAYFTDMFLLFANDERNQRPTATEVNERSQERLLALGPVLEQTNQDLLDPNIEITFDIMNRQGLLPMPPQELHGVPLKVEYISIMAQAQKAAGLSGIERFMQFANANAEQFPSLKDKVNPDALMDVYGDMTSIPPQIIRPDDEVAQMRQKQQQAAQQQQQAEMQNQQSQTAKNLSQADLGGNSALGALLNQSKAGQLVQQ